MAQIIHIFDLFILALSILILLLQVCVGGLLIALIFACGIVLAAGRTIYIDGGGTIEQLKRRIIHRRVIGAYLLISGVWCVYCVLTYNFSVNSIFQPRMDITVNGKPY